MQQRLEISLSYVTTSTAILCDVHVCNEQQANQSHICSMCTCETCFRLPPQHSKICERASSACCGNNLQKRHFGEFPYNTRIIAQRCYTACFKQQQRDGEYHKLLKHNKRASEAPVTGLYCLLVDTEVATTLALRVKF